MSKIPADHTDLLTGPICVAVATLRSDGQPQVTPMWCSYDGEHILVNTTMKNKKAQNLSARPMVTILATDPENPYRYLEVQGEVESISDEGAIEHANELTQLYMGKPRFYGDVAPAELEGNEPRVMIRIRPKRASTSPFT